MVKLNLGCGQNKKDGYINVDKYDSFAPDVVWDLEIFPWPFENNSVEEIVLHHVLEHLGASVDTFLAIMKELYRISKPDAQIFIAVPHPRSDGYMGDPTHVRPISQNVLSLFSKKSNREWQEKGWPNSPLATYIDVDFDMTDVKLAFLSPWAEEVKAGTRSREEIQFAINSYFNVVDEIKITLVARK